MQQYAYLPSLALSFSYSFLTQSDMFNLSQWKWFPSSTLGLSLSIPIFSGGQRYHAIKQTRVQADELELQRVNAERQLRIGIRQSLNTMETAMKTYDASKEALVSAEKAYDIATKSYQLGKSTLTDLNNTELVLTQSKLAVSQAVYNFVIAKAGLEQTLGYDFNDEKYDPRIRTKKHMKRSTLSSPPLPAAACGSRSGQSRNARPGCRRSPGRSHPDRGSGHRHRP